MPALAGFNEWWRHTRPEDVIELAPIIRQADREEVAALGLTVDQVLAISVMNSRGTFSMIERNTDRVLGMFGVSRGAQPEVGVIWALVSDEVIHRFSLVFLRISKPWIEWANDQYPMLANIVHEKNTEHVKWLKWLGCTFIGRSTYNGEPFLEFVRLKPHV